MSARHNQAMAGTHRVAIIAGKCQLIFDNCIGFDTKWTVRILWHIYFPDWQAGKFGFCSVDKQDAFLSVIFIPQ
jgi:hypothetical protein